MSCHEEGHILHHTSTHEGRGVWHQCSCGYRRFFGMAPEGECPECEEQSPDFRENHHHKLAEGEFVNDCTYCDKPAIAVIRQPHVGIGGNVWLCEEHDYEPIPCPICSEV